jgi:DNA-binding response OmpR family regulator
MKILVVEDQIPLLTQIEKLISKEGYVCETASDTTNTHNLILYIKIMRLYWHGLIQQPVVIISGVMF